MSGSAASPTIPVLRGPEDSLHALPQSLKQAAIAPHIVQVVQNEALRNEWEAKLFLVDRVYGSHAAWERRMDRAALSQTRRLPGLQSAHVGLDHVLNRDDKIDFEDYLNVPDLRPRVPTTGVHERIEREIGMK